MRDYRKAKEEEKLKTSADYISAWGQNDLRIPVLFLWFFPDSHQDVLACRHYLCLPHNLRQPQFGGGCPAGLGSSGVAWRSLLWLKHDVGGTKQTRFISTRAGDVSLHSRSREILKSVINGPTRLLKFLSFEKEKKRPEII